MACGGQERKGFSSPLASRPIVPSNASLSYYETPVLWSKGQTPNQTACTLNFVECSTETRNPREHILPGLLWKVYLVTLLTYPIIYTFVKHLILHMQIHDLYYVFIHHIEKFYVNSKSSVVVYTCPLPIITHTLKSYIILS